MFYFICGAAAREFKYFELLDRIKAENPGIKEFVYDVVLKEDDKFFEKLNFNSIFGGKEILVLKRAEKLGNVEEVLNLISNVELNSKFVIRIGLVFELKNKSSENGEWLDFISTNLRKKKA